jgi:hypothetical protein
MNDFDRAEHHLGPEHSGEESLGSPDLLPVPITNEPVIIRSFDYAALPKEVAAVAKRLAETIRNERKRGVEIVIAIGNALRAARRDMEHGQWLHWLEVEAEMDPRTAQRYIAAAEYVEQFAQGKCDTLSYLEITTVHRLVAASTPESVKIEVGQRLVEGEKIPNDAVKRMVTEGRKAAEQEKRENAEVAKLTPKARQARARRRKQQQEEAEANRREWQMREAKQRKAAAELVAFLAEKLGDEDMREVRRLHEEAGWEFARALRERA